MKRVSESQQKDDFMKRGFSRRDLGRVAAMIAAGAALPFWNEPAMAQLSAIRGPMPADAVKINANENPLDRAKKRWRRSTRWPGTAAGTSTKKLSPSRNYWPNRRA